MHLSYNLSGIDLQFIISRNYLRSLYFYDIMPLTTMTRFSHYLIKISLFSDSIFNTVREQESIFLGEGQCLTLHMQI